MLTPTFTRAINDIGTVLAQPHSIGDGVLSVASSGGFPSPTPENPIRVTCTRKVDGVVVIFLITDISGTTWTIDSAIEDTADITLNLNDTVEVFVSAGYVNDAYDAIENVVDAINDLPLGGAIGGAVSGGDPNSVLFIDASGNMAQSANFLFSSSSFTVTKNTQINGNLTINGAASNLDRLSIKTTRFSNTDSILMYTSDGSGFGSGTGSIRINPAFDSGLAGVFFLNSSGASINAHNADGTPTSKLILQSQGGKVGINDTSPGSQLQVTTGSATTKGVIVKGFTSQSADLQQWQDSTGTVVTSVAFNGSITSKSPIGIIAPTSVDGISLRSNNSSSYTAFSIGRTAGEAYLGVAALGNNWANGTFAGDIALVANGGKIHLGMVDATANLVLNQDGSTTANGNIQLPGSSGLASSTGHGLETYAYYSIYLEGQRQTTSPPTPASDYTSQHVKIPLSQAGVPGLVIKGFTSQSADLQQWQDSTGTALAAIDPSGVLIFSSSAWFKSGTDTLFRSVKNVGWNDNATAFFFQAGNSSANVIISTQSGIPATRMLLAATKLHISGAAYNTLAAPTYQVQIDSSSASTPVLGVKGLPSVVKTINNVALTSNVATITTSTAHGLSTGTYITVSGLTHTGLNGTFLLTSVTSTTLTYAKTASDITSVADSGSVFGNGQTANLHNWTDATGTVLASINSLGCPSFPDTGVLSERVGLSSVASGTQSVAFGNGATASNVLTTALGFGSQATGVGGTSVGSATVVSGSNSLALGRNATTANNYSCAIGYFISSLQDYQLRFGIGGGVPSTAPSFALAGMSSTTGNLSVFAINTSWADSTHATRKARAILSVNDTANREAIRMETDGSLALTSIGGNSVIAATTLAVLPQSASYTGLVVKGFTSQSADLQQWQDSAGDVVARVAAGGSVVVGSTLATTATDGFLYIPTCAGTPTGTPTSHTGTVAQVYDSSNKILYVYAGGSWVAV